jgi:mRNA-degrading endonuclease RelE of RelBE toxin-antitoxin system
MLFCAIADNPRPPGCIKLRNREGGRIRIGDYRVIYEISDENLIVINITWEIDVIFITIRYSTSGIMEVFI